MNLLVHSRLIGPSRYGSWMIPAWPTITKLYFATPSPVSFQSFCSANSFRLHHHRDQHVRNSSRGSPYETLPAKKRDILRVHSDSLPSCPPSSPSFSPISPRNYFPDKVHVERVHPFPHLRAVPCKLGDVPIMQSLLIVLPHHHHASARASDLGPRSAWRIQITGWRSPLRCRQHRRISKLPRRGKSTVRHGRAIGPLRSCRLGSFFCFVLEHSSGPLFRLRIRDPSCKLLAPGRLELGPFFFQISAAARILHRMATWARTRFYRGNPVHVPPQVLFALPSLPTSRARYNYGSFYKKRDEKNGRLARPNPRAQVRITDTSSGSHTSVTYARHLRPPSIISVPIQ